MKSHLTAPFVYGIATTLLLIIAPPARAATLDWVRKFGSPSLEESGGVSADGLGNIFITGYTYGSLAGPNAGDNDAFLAKYDTTGSLQWTRQLGTTNSDEGSGVSADGLGNVYIAGRTRGNLGNPNAGFWDAYVAKYDTTGTLLWTRQLGTATLDESLGVSADGVGNVYISGVTGGSLGGPYAGGGDAFVAKYDTAGNHQWTHQLGTSAVDESYGVSADGSGNVFITGYTLGNLGGPNAGGSDAYVAKYDATGAHQWTRQFGTGKWEGSGSVSADGLGNVYIAGSTSDNLDENTDAWVAKYDTAGNHQWTRQLGTSATDSGSGVLADGLGNVYLSGTTAGNLGGPNAGGDDAFLAKYDTAGSLLWIRQFGSTSEGGDTSSGVSIDGLGNIYIAGDTLGDLGGPNTGGRDAWVAKLVDGLPGDFDNDGDVDGRDFLALQRNPSIGSLADWQANYGAGGSLTAADVSVPEPTSAALLGLVLLGGASKWNRRRQ